MNFFLVLNPCFECFLTGTILSIRFLLTHPGYIKLPEMSKCIQFQKRESLTKRQDPSLSRPQTGQTDRHIFRLMPNGYDLEKKKPNFFSSQSWRKKNDAT